MYKITIAIIIVLIIGYIAFLQIESFNRYEEDEEDAQMRKSQYITMENVYGMDSGYIR